MKEHQYEYISEGRSYGHRCEICGYVISNERGWGLRRICRLPHKAYDIGPCPPECLRSFAHRSCVLTIDGGLP
jgi:hypothetical protein